MDLTEVRNITSTSARLYLTPDLMIKTHSPRNRGFLQFAICPYSGVVPRRGGPEGTNNPACAYHLRCIRKRERQVPRVSSQRPFSCCASDSLPYSLSNLFNVLPRRSSLRLQVYQALLSLAASQDEIDLLGINLADVERWLSEWDIPAEDKSGLLKSVSDAYEAAGQP